MISHPLSWLRPSLDWHFLLKGTGYYISEGPLLPQNQVLHTWQAINTICWMTAGKFLGWAFLFNCLRQGKLMLQPFYTKTYLPFLVACSREKYILAYCFALLWCFSCLKSKKFTLDICRFEKKMYFSHTNMRKTKNSNTFQAKLETWLLCFLEAYFQTLMHIKTRSFLYHGNDGIKCFTQKEMSFVTN